MSLKNIVRARYKIDFVNDVKRTAIKAKLLLEESFKKQDIYGFLLAMIVKSDYSFVHKEIEPAAEEIELKLKEKEKNFFDLFEHPIEIVLKLKLENNQSLVWLGSIEISSFSLYFNNGNFSKIHLLENLNSTEIKNWRKLNYGKLILEEYSKNKNGSIVKKFKEDYEQQDKDIKNDLKFATLDIDKNIEHLLLVKDIFLSSFPHNLLLDNSGEYISSYIPCACILSIEWLNQARNLNKNVCDSTTKEIWIPIVDGDFSLNMLYNELEKDLLKYNFSVHTSRLPNNPLNSNINIIAAHGDENIASFYALHFSNEVSVSNFNYIVGDGDILIMLVCHSGSMDEDMFRNKTSALIRKFLEGKYQAVIAPFWALHVKIPRIWLNQFLIEFEEGEFIINAVHKANMAVSEKYPFVGAWGCMHLYGNPYLKKINKAENNV